LIEFYVLSDNTNHYLKVLRNVVKKVLKPGGSFVTPRALMAKLVGKNEINPSLSTHKLIVEMMKKYGFIKPKPYNTGNPYHPTMNSNQVTL